MPSISTALTTARSSRGYLFSVVSCSVLLTTLAVIQWVRETRGAEPGPGSPGSAQQAPAADGMAPADLERATKDATDRLQSAESALAAIRPRHEATAGELDNLYQTAKRLEEEIHAQEALVTEALRLREEQSGPAAGSEEGPPARSKEQQAKALEESLADLQAQRTQLLTRFTAYHPVVLDIDRRIAEVAGKLKRAQLDPPTDPETPAEVPDNGTEAVLAAEQKLEELQTELEEVNAARDEQTLLLASMQEEIDQHEVEAQHAKEELARLEEVAARAVKSAPSPGGRRGTDAVGLVVSLAFGCFMGCVASIKAKPVDKRIRNRMEVESILALPLIGLIPGSDDAPLPPPLPDLRVPRRMRLIAEVILGTFTLATCVAVAAIDGHSQRLAAHPLSTIADGVRVIAAHVLA